MRLPEVNQRVSLAFTWQRRGAAPVEVRVNTRVEDVVAPNAVVVAAPAAGELLESGMHEAELFAGDPVVIEWTSARGVSRGTGTVSIAPGFEDTVPVVSIALEKSEIIQRREHVRADLTLEAEISQIGGSPVQCNTIEVSGGGMRAVVPLELVPDEGVVVVLHLEGERPFECEARVVRAIDEGVFSFEFFIPNEDEQQRLIRYAFAAHTHQFATVRRPD